MRDSKDGAKPWMKKGSFKALGAPDGKKVYAQDRPRVSMPLRVPLE